MRKVFLDNLPSDGKNIYWRNSVGYKVKVIYDDFKGIINITGYKEGRLFIECNNKQYDIATSGFKNCELGLFIKHINLDKELYDRWYKLKNENIKTTFKLSKDGNYWIGHTWEYDEFWFDGDEETINYIKNHTWRKISDGYFQNEKEEKLHRIVMGIKDTNIFINHLGGNKWDNRKHMLSISDSYDNSKEKIRSSRNKSGITGLLKRRNKWVGSIKINDLSIYSKYKSKEEALIDLLIMQKHYGFRHNENLYYLIENISNERIKEVIDNCERQLNKKANHSIKSTNKYELSKDKTYYNVYDEKGQVFKISLESIDKVKQGIWHVAHDISNNSISVHGTIINDKGKRITVKLHRFLFDLIDNKYKNWFVVKNNNDELDNRMENMVITDKVGNGLSKKQKGYTKRLDKYRLQITILGIHHCETVDTEEEAIELIHKLREEGLKNRLQFNSKEELDEYLNNKNNLDNEVK